MSSLRKQILDLRVLLLRLQQIAVLDNALLAELLEHFGRLVRFGDRRVLQDLRDSLGELVLRERTRDLSNRAADRLAEIAEPRVSRQLDYRHRRVLTPPADQ
jgi:hypothetical protein